MLMIRLQRVGKTKSAAYRFIVNEKAQDTRGTYLENLGTYNPHDKKDGLKLNVERIQYWMGKGAGVSDTVNNLLLKAGVIKGSKKRSVFISKKRVVKIEAKKASEKK